MESVPLAGIASLIPTLSCMLSLTDDNGKKSYEGYQVLRIGSMSSDEMGFSTLQQLFKLDGLFDFMETPSKNQATDVILCKQQVNTVKTIFNQFQIPYEVLVPDLQKRIDSSQAANAKALQGTAGMSWKAYHRLSTIQSWMDSVAQKYPNLASVETFGKSFEGRALKVLKISQAGFGTKPAVWIDGGIHAREWVASSTASFIGNYLIELAEKDPNNRLISSVDWYIVPNVNPDGYEFTFTGDRLWRKTRSTTRGSRCKGADPNRNWDFQWGKQGTSNDPCSEIYRGSKPASEREVSIFQKYIYDKRDHIKLFISFHSYSQLLFTPWAYDNVRLDDKDDLLPIAENAANALKAVHGTEYKVGTPPELLYPAAGGSYDWAKGVAGIKFSYTFELRDTGDYGFLLPPNQIIPTGEETLAAVESMVNGVMSYYKIDGFE